MELSHEPIVLWHRTATRWWPAIAIAILNFGGGSQRATERNYEVTVSTQGMLVTDPAMRDSGAGPRKTTRFIPWIDVADIQLRRAGNQRLIVVRRRDGTACRLSAGHYDRTEPGDADGKFRRLRDAWDASRADGT